VILAKTIKGYGMGEAGEGRNITHQQKAMNEEARLAIRDRLGLPLTDEQATGAFFHRPPADSPELRYLLERRTALGGSIPARNREAEPLPTPAPFESVLEGSGERENSTTWRSCGS
jgi:pyruvate dehydrogenase E1 component